VECETPKKRFNKIWQKKKKERRKKKKKKKTNPTSFYILGYLLKLIIKIWRFRILFFFEIWRIWAIFAMEKILLIG